MNFWFIEKPFDANHVFKSKINPNSKEQNRVVMQKYVSYVAHVRTSWASDFQLFTFNE